MKLLAGFLWTALGACSVAAEALIYISDVPPPASRAATPSISPNTARLLLARRLGLSQYHSLEGADESTLDILNTYGGKQQQLFTHEEHTRSNDRLLLIVDGVTKPEDIFAHSIRPAATIDSHPSISQNIDLVQDLLEQDQDSRAKEYNRCHFQIPSSSILPGGSILSGGLGTSHVESHSCGQWYQRLAHHASGVLAKTPLSGFKDAFEAFGSEGSAHTIVLHISSLEGLTPKDGDLYTAAVSDLKAFINYFHQPKKHISSTIVIMPATSQSSKRSTTSPYGNYLKPLFPRQQPEEPLSSTSNPSAHPPSAPEVLQTSPSPLPHGVLPVCYSNLETAAARTNNCSGHGSIYQKSTGEDHACFACRCSKTVLTDEEGRVKTIYWGGAACQKKDVSVPFFLLAGLTIALVGTVTWGVGLLMSVGNEELPSVIGAGVAGPRAQTQK